MNFNSRDNQTDKKASQAQDKANQAKKGPKPKKLKKRPRKKKKVEDIKDNKTNKVDHKTVVLLQLELMPLQRKKQVVLVRRRKKPKISPKSLIIIVTKKAIISPIVPSQNIICNLDDFHVSDCQLGGLISSALYSIPGFVPRRLGPN